MSINTQKYKPDFVVPPGTTLKELLQKIGMTQSELATRISRPLKTINEIINGSVMITPETSLQFEKALNIPASFWNNLQKNYQEKLARIEQRERLKGEVNLLDEFPYQTAAKYGWLEKADDKIERVENILSFFGVDSLKLVQKIYPVVFRLHNGKTTSPISLAIWLRKGEIDGQNIQTSSYNSEGIYGLINKFKTYTLESPKTFIPTLVDEMAKNGVALVFTRNLPNTLVCGATRWLTPEKALVQLSLRGSYADIMWFTLFHELAHILLHGKKERFIDLKEKRSGDQDEETEADRFAAIQLIPKNEFDSLVSSGNFSADNIKAIATRLEIHPGIIVGRLQHEKIIGFNQLNQLRVKYIWENNP